jgi:hypothetical protein
MSTVKNVSQNEVDCCTVKKSVEYEEEEEVSKCLIVTSFLSKPHGDSLLIKTLSNLIPIFRLYLHIN